MPFEDIADFANQFWSKPAQRLDIHRRDTPLHTNRFYLNAVATMGKDFRSTALGIARITNPDGNMVVPGRQQRRGMQDLGPKICQLSRFIETHPLDKTCIGA